MRMASKNASLRRSLPWQIEPMISQIGVDATSPCGHKAGAAKGEHLRPTREGIPKINTARILLFQGMSDYHSPTTGSSDM